MTNNTKHTAGPWKAPKVGAYVEAARGVVVAQCGPATDETACANARLIASAPELLEALRCVVATMAHDNPALDVARAAIRKAEEG